MQEYQNDDGYTLNRLLDADTLLRTFWWALISAVLKCSLKNCTADRLIPRCMTVELIFEIWFWVERDVNVWDSFRKKGGWGENLVGNGGSQLAREESKKWERRLRNVFPLALPWFITMKEKKKKRKKKKSTGGQRGQTVCATERLGYIQLADRRRDCQLSEEKIPLGRWQHKMLYAKWPRYLPAWL